MYIPTQFFGQVNTCISASGGDEIGQFISGSTVWKYHKFTTLGSSSFTIHSGSSNDFRVFLVGGGGGGGRSDTNPAGGSPQSAGGGGAGGVVYTDFRFGPGTHSLYIGDGGIYNVSGEDTWLQVDYEPSDYAGYYPTSSQLTAEGGGRGASLTYFDSVPNRAAQAGGSGGGGVRGLVQGPGGSGLQFVQLPPNGGRTPQGFGGGKVYIPTGGSTSFEAGPGGGGAAESGSDANFSGTAFTAARGGHGLQFNVDGNDRYYAGGGGGFGENVYPLSVALGSNYYGSGGSGSNDNVNPGTINGHDKRSGRQGIAVVMYPVCQLATEDCTTYTVNGGALGGTITYYPCGGNALVSSSLVFEQAATICTYVVPPYPIVTGTVTAVSGSACDTEIPIEQVPQCDTGSGEVLFSSFVYNWTLAQKCYPTPSSCQRSYTIAGTLTYTTNDGTPITQSIGGGFVSNTGQICARDVPPPTISDNGQGEFGVTSITKTNNVCGYYCAVPPPGPVSGSVINVTGINTGSFYNTQFVGPTSLQNIQNTGVTLEVWGKNPALTQNYDAFLGLWDGQSSPNRDWIEIREDGNNHVLGDIYNQESPSFENKTTPSSAVADRNNWYHHIITFDTGSSVMKYYRNGQLEGSVSSSLDSNISYQTVHVGQQEDGPICNMYIGEYRVYVTPLSPTNVLNNFDETKARYGY